MTPPVAMNTRSDPMAAATALAAKAHDRIDAADAHGSATLLRYAYCSRAANGVPAQRDDLAVIAATAQARNAREGITGALVAANGYYLQVLEGPPAAVESLIARLHADPRHIHLVELDRSTVVRRLFGDTSYAWIERAEREADTRERIRRLLEVLRHDPQVRVEDYFRLMLAPQVPSPAASTVARGSGRRVLRVLITGAASLWGPAMLQHAAGLAHTRVGRSSVQLVGADQRRHLVEYVDTALDDGRPLRLLCVDDHSAMHATGAQLMGQIDLLVLMASASDLADCAQRAQPVLRRAAQLPRSPMALLVSGASPERTEATAVTLAAASGLSVEGLSARLSDVPSVWAQLHAAITLVASTLDAPAEGQHDTALRALADARSLERLMVLDGALEAGLLCLDGQRLVHSVVAESGTSSALAEQLDWIARLAAVCDRSEGGDIDDVVVQTRDRVEVYRPVPDQPHWLLAVHLHREGTSLAQVRLTLEAEAQALNDAVSASEPPATVF